MGQTASQERCLRVRLKMARIPENRMKAHFFPVSFKETNGKIICIHCFLCAEGSLAKVVLFDQNMVCVCLKY